MGQYYNTSEGSEMLSQDTGFPYPFVPRSLPGRRNGQPFLLAAGVSAYRAQQ
eukprot:gene8429-10015_t